MRRKRSLRALAGLPRPAILVALLAAVVVMAAAVQPGIAATPDQSIPNIRVRTGEHARYSRIVFDWTSRVDYWLRRDVGQATVVFKRSATFDLSRLGRPPARWIRDVEPEPIPGGVSVRLDVPVGAEVRHLRVGPKVVVDVYRPRRGGGSAAASAKAAPAETATPEDQATGDQAAEDQADSTEPREGAEPATPPQTPPVPEAGAEGAAEDRIAADTADVPAGEAESQTAVGEAERQVEPEPADARQPDESATGAMSDEPEKATTAPPPEQPDRTPEAQQAAPTTPHHETKRPVPDAGAPEAKPVVSVPPRTELQRAEPQPTPQPTVAEPGMFRVPWREPTGAAVFRRGGWIWSVFDRPSRQDTAALAASAGRGVAQLQQLADEEATILRMAAAATLTPVVERDGLAWVVRLVVEPGPESEPSDPIEPAVELVSPVGPRLMLPVDDAGPPITVADPEIGDPLIVVPVVPAGRGVGHTYEYPQVRILKTAHGIAIDPRADDVQVQSLRTGVEITIPGGLQITPVSETAQIRARIGPWLDLSRVLDARSWPQPLTGDAFATREQALRRAATSATGPARSDALMDAAQFYLAHGLETECLGALTAAVEETPDAARGARLRLLRGACRLLMGRLPEAAEDLSYASLDGTDEGTLWQGALQAAQGQSQGTVTLEELLRAGPLVLSYPPALRAPLTALIAEAAALAGDAEAARRYVDVLRVEEDEPVPTGEIALLEGRIRALEGDPAGALAQWTNARQDSDRRSGAEAAMATVDLKLEQGEMTPEEAIEALEALRFAWRGDGFEFDLLRRLAGLYRDQEQYRQDLLTLREAATHFPDHPEVPEVSKEMAGLFEQLYLEGGAEALSPLAAIALFDEFRELTPAGAKGNEMIRRLADRLVAVDLLDRAEELLADQVRHRLPQGTERARVGARLGLVYLLDRKPEETLQALDASDAAALPPDLDRQRRQLKARALAELERFDEALALIGADDSTDADLLRADVFWQQKDWRRAAQALARLAVNAGARPGQPLDQTQARYVLNRAVALSLDGDENGLARLRRGYGTAMAASPYGDAFRLIAGADVETAGDLRALVSADVKQAEGFQAFLAAYRDRLREGSLSAIN